MTQEVELKLSLPEYAVADFFALAQQADQPLGVPQGPPLLLDNQYFDTDDLALNRSHAALRIRKSQHGFKQTLKNKGQAIAGLHQRGEWEYDILDANIDWSLFPAELNIDPCLKDAIKPVFKTDFTRHVWIKSFGDSEIELVLDQGQIHNDRKNCNLCEVELELKQGKAEDLFKFARQLAGQLPLVPCDINKAERGYGLESRVSFYHAPEFIIGDKSQFDSNVFLQDALTRINRHWDAFSQKKDWWSLLIISRHVEVVDFMLGCMDEAECPSLTTPLDSEQLLQVKAHWKQLKQDLIELLTPARVVIALFVDDHSNSRGLSQRLLQTLTNSLNGSFQLWLRKNSLGQSLLQLGELLYQHGEALGQNHELVTRIWSKISVLQLRAVEMPVQQFHDLQTIQSLAYVFKRFNHPAYDLCNQLIKQQMVVLGMNDAQAICVINDESSRAKLSSWVRRITVEQRRMNDVREKLKDKLSN